MLKGYHTPFPVIVELTRAVRATAIAGSDAHTVPPRMYIDPLPMCRTMGIIVVRSRNTAQCT